MKKIRIGSGAGYADDRIEPAIDLINRGNLDYIGFECLAERTIAIAQNQKQADPTKGYNDLLEYRFSKILPAIKAHPTKVITNMGAANPQAATAKVVEMAQKAGLSHLKVATVTGDDVTHKISQFGQQPMMENHQALSTLNRHVISANAYLGAQPIVEALDQGADIVITGRVADPSLFIAPLVHEFGWSFEDYDKLGKGTLLGHLLECAGQVSGGYFADPGYKDVDNLWELGFPYADVQADGDIVLHKLPNTGGLLNEDTVKEQLIYEIQDPTKYYTPDVVADFSNVEVHAVTSGIHVSGATGTAKTKKLKVSVGYEDGYITEGGINYGGHNAFNKAKLANEIVQKRLELLKIPVDAFQADYIGVDSLYHGVLPAPAQISEVRARIAARTSTAAAAHEIVREGKSLYTNGPSAGGGVRTITQKIVAIASITIPEDETQPQINYTEVN
ncbi:acyclic terpene utilization AtuA family protein [Levilactobacillus zymae]|uniref:acyclic terpene utilization AtuA family protein n=1 Tax=Levilactobacillus zymae TaxID=267363 RepID=UPI0028B49E8E|nr:acyclic terpene utilization AtuA family protein [Levilactobacillus zymae]MDT6979617.1 acyclic terpene utilization AtuA family protein [Levilactobacillus zymae]